MKRYIKSFQGLRFFAAILVFLGHCGYFLNSKGENVFGLAGAFAVSIFFMLSGFLAQMNRGGVAISKESVKSIFGECKKSFLKAVKKYYPLHLLTILLVIPMWIKRFISTPLFSISALFANLFLVQSWVPIKYFAQTTFNGVAWFLSTELFLMTVSPFVVRFVSKRKRISAIILSVGIVLFQIMISFLVNGLELGNWIVYVFPPMRVLDFVLGAIAFKISTRTQESDNSKVLSDMMVILTIAIGVVALIFSIGNTHMVFYSAYWSVPAFLAVYCFATFERTSFVLKWAFSNRIIVFLGKITYEFFLLHMVVWGYGTRGFKFFHIQNGLLLVCLVFTVSLGASIVLYLLKVHFAKKKTVTKEEFSTHAQKISDEVKKADDSANGGEG